jgi:hypothetical protein
MNIKIIAALIIAVFLAGTHWKAYVSGKATVTKEWELDRAESARLARAQQDANRDATRKAEIRYFDSETVRTEFLVVTQKELVNETKNLESCILTDGAIGLLNKAADAARAD